ncbi:ORF6N domain-containing protein [Treponema bryantii]|uniref:ORF6N domain-containing protein n=1 Tax=Treponema bryantii TaxID=163 RepID=A0A1H9A3C6_9SPIR|nr:ORF6N domain-containing protein [Treponema bryantii]SEP71190.1 ORF6N domain-containing protein [Treponema bryantii]
MEKEMTVIDRNSIESKILNIRNKQVMLDSELAAIYGIETKVFNQAVKRNIERFPDEFRFQLTEEETNTFFKPASRSQFVTLNSSGNLRGSNIKYRPYAFTEQGVAMLSAVLRSETAVKVSIEIMNAFVQMRHYLQENVNIISRLTNTDTKLLEHDKNFERIFAALESNPKPKKEGVFFQGQIFDAYVFFQNIIQKAKKEIILIDGYVDLSVLEQLSKKKSGVQVTIYTDSKTKISALDVQKFNSQYPQLTLNYTSKMHDRFLIIDNKTVYHIGASLKDLGKKCFAFELMEESAVLIPVILKNL